MSSSSSINKCYYNYELPINSLNSNFKSSIHYIEPLKYDKCSYEIKTETNSNNTNIKNYQISNSSISIKNDKSLFTQVKSIAKEKLIYKYNCTKRKYNIYIINNLLRNDYCCIVSKFKDNILINNFNKEYFYKYYKTPEIKSTMVKFYPFYKTYFNFYCKPILNDIPLAANMKHYFDTKAKCFLNMEYHNENTNFDDNHNLSKKNSDSSEDLANDSKNNNDNIFNSKVKDALDNVTIMTTIPNDSETGSINLNIDKERIEIYRENKKEYSNDTTFAEIMDFIENKKYCKNSFLKFNKLRNKVKNELLKSKNNIIKNCLNYNKNNFELRNNFMNVLKKHNKKKIPINKINILLQKIKMNNLGKKINRNLLQENNDKSIDNKNKPNDINKSVNSNINSNSNSNKGYSNLGNIIVKSSNLNIDEKPYIAKKINTKKINEDIRKYYKNINNIINDYQNKENINNNYITNTNNSKNIKKVNKSISNIKPNKDNKIINQKISFKNRKKQSRNKNSFYQSIQSLSSINQNPERSQNIKNKKISLHKTFVKNQSNNKTLMNNNDTLKSLVPPSKTNHLRHKTKFIKYQNVEKIFQNIYSKIKKTYINNNYQIQNNDHNNNNQSTLFKTLIIDNSSLNNINHNLINSPVNAPIDNSISNTFLKKSIYHSIYNNGSANMLQKKENSKLNFKIRKIKNDNKRYSINQNSMNNKSYSLNKTSDKNYFLNNYLNVANSLKKSYKSLSKKKKYMYNKKIYTLNKKRIKNIKSFNNRSLNNRGKGQMNIDESKYKNIQKINSFSNKRKHKNTKFKEIYINIKKEIKSSKYDLIKIAKKCYNEKTNSQNHNLNSIHNFKKKEKKIKLRNDDLRNKTGKTTVNNLKYMDNSRYTTNKDNFNNIINSFHNKSQSTYGLDLNSRKFMKFYM